MDDQVFLRLQPYKQMFIKVHSYMKLSPRFFGPYKMLERNGQVVYPDLSASSKIHPVFHVSCLRKKLGEHDLMQHHLPDISFTSEVETQSQAILDRRVVQHHKYPEVLVQWASLSIKDATWESYRSEEERLPKFVATQP